MTRTYVVTGSASGIGATTARLLAERGERVIGIDLRNADIEADLSVPEGRADAAQLLRGDRAPHRPAARAGRVGCAASRRRLVDGLAPAELRAALAGDEASALRIAAELAEQGPELGYLVYPSSKRALARWVRRESITPAWAGAGIPLNAVAPGTVITPMTADLLKTPEGAAMVDAAVPMPLNDHQPPESVANLLIWLTSVENTHLAGQVVYDDGGADATLRGDDIWSWNDSGR